MSTIRTGTLVLLLLLLFGPPRFGAAQQQSLAVAKTLYASAAYEEALTVLDRLKPASPASGDARGIAEYRAFCLLALDRKGEAERAIEEIVAVDPFFLPDASDTSPRVLAAFHAVRRRVLGEAVQKRYAEAKATFDAKDFETATAQMEAVVRLLGDPDLAESATVADLRVLAAGFLDLARAAATPPPPPPPPEPVAPPAPVEPSVYDASHPSVTPPVARRQEVPRWPLGVLGPIGPALRRGVLEILVDEQGQVASATILESVDRRYDEILLAAARNWRYTPAQRDGRAVRYAKRIQIVVQ